MKPSLIDPNEVVRQSMRRAESIQVLEDKLQHEREMRAMDACWLVRNTTCTRTQIAAVLGISRVTLDKYLADAGMDDAYLAEVRKVQKDQGVTLFDSRDLQIFTGEA